MGPPAAPCSPPEPRAIPDDTEAPGTARPTHRLNNIRCGGNGVQLLVSTRDHLYDADDVEAGEGSWQVVGAWSDESAPELTKMLGQRSSMGSSVRPAMRPQASTQSHFDRGAGQKLGTVAEQSGSVSN